MMAAMLPRAVRMRGLARRRTPIVAGALAIGVVAALAVLVISPALAASAQVTLAAGPGAPNGSGEAEIELEGATLAGSVSASELPAQEFGSGRFYGVWFVRTDTGDKAFLGALIQDDSIIFSRPGDGELRFAATKFTTGPDAGSPIRLGPTGTNLVLVLIENTINGLTPSPVGPVPGAGVALSGTF